MLSFSDRAQAVLEDWRAEVASMEAGAIGLFLSWLGKLPGFAVRLAVIFAHVAWSCSTAGSNAGDAPTEIGEADILRAVTILADYYVPMARRAFGEAGLPQAERDSRRLARWLLRQKVIPAELNVRELLRMADGPGIGDASRIEATLEELAALGWVRAALPNRAGVGDRSRNDWTVNPALSGGKHEMA